LYTGDPLFINRVKWRFGDHRDVLVTTAEPVERTVLSTIVSIAALEFHLTADGDWEGPTTEAQSMGDAEATCMGKAPRDDALKQDFVMTIESLKELQEVAAAIPSSEKVGLLRAEDCYSTLWPYSFSLLITLVLHHDRLSPSLDD
jgi:hypothetical protein